MSMEGSRKREKKALDAEGTVEEALRLLKGIERRLGELIEEQFPPREK